MCFESRFKILEKFMTADQGIVGLGIQTVSRCWLIDFAFSLCGIMGPSGLNARLDVLKS
jgi:hypothetical protein